MTDAEKQLLRRKWKYSNEFRTFENVMGKIEGFGELDFSTDGVLILRDNFGRFNYSFVDRVLEIYSPVSFKNVLRIRIADLTTDKLVITISVKRGDEADGNLSKELVELTYRPVNDQLG